MVLEPSDIMRITFDIVYLIYIAIIVTLMTINLKNLDERKLKTGKRIIFAFVSLFIGDIGHVGSRMIGYFISEIEVYHTLIGIGTIFEMVGLTFLFILFLDAWRLLFNHPNNLLFKMLIGIGFIGLVIFIFPQNQWFSETSPYDWLVIRNIPWTILGIAVAILINKDARPNKDRRLLRISIYIVVSFMFYIPAILLLPFIPMLGMLMIFGTIAYMLWQYESYKRFFKE